MGKACHGRSLYAVSPKSIYTGITVLALTSPAELEWRRTKRQIRFRERRPRPRRLDEQFPRPPSRLKPPRRERRSALLRRAEPCEPHTALFQRYVS